MGAPACHQRGRKPLPRFAASRGAWTESFSSAEKKDERECCWQAQPLPQPQLQLFRRRGAETAPAPHQTREGQEQGRAGKPDRNLSYGLEGCIPAAVIGFISLTIIVGTDRKETTTQAGRQAPSLGKYSCRLPTCALVFSQPVRMRQGSGYLGILCTCTVICASKHAACHRVYLHAPH